MLTWFLAGALHALSSFFHVVDSSEQLGTFKDFIKTFPEIDTPEIFGLHPNADLTFRVKEVNALFGTLGNTQPKVRSTSHAWLPLAACNIPTCR